jgi:hypothetical protein
MQSEQHFSQRQTGLATGERAFFVFSDGQIIAIIKNAI